MRTTLGIAIVGLLFAGCEQQRNADCTFKRIAGTYRVSGVQLARLQNSSRPMITVTRDGRTFMFPRHQVEVCEVVLIDEDRE